MAIETLPEPSIPITTPFRPGLGFLTSTPIISAATICLVLIILSAILAPWLSPHDPLLLAPAQRLKPASALFPLGTDGYGRDVLSRILYGGRISLVIGLGAAVFSVTAAGTDAIYQWVRDTNTLTGETNNTLILTNVSAADAGLYSVLTSGTLGGPFTNYASLTLNQNATASPMSNLVRNPGATAVFSTTPAGAGP